MNRTALLGRIGWGAILLLLALAYANGLHAPFVYDDRIEVVGNATIRDVTEWRAVLHYNVSRVLLVWSYAWNYHLWGLDPLGYHVVSLVIQGLCVGAGIAMAFAVGRLGGHAFPMAAAVGAVAVWAVHPMGVEAVTYITGRSESLCALFCLASLASWARAMGEEAQGRRAVGLRLLGIAAAIAAFMTKEVAGALPLSALAMEMILGPRAQPVRQRPKWLWYLPFVVLIGLAAWGRVTFAGQLLPSEVDRPLGVQLATQAEVWLRYLQLWLIPVGQTLFHHVPEVHPTSGRGVLTVAVWLGVVGLSVRWAWRRPLVAWALLTGALFLLPSSSFVPLKESMAEHRAYGLGLYLCLAVAWSVRETGRRRWTSATIVLLPILVLLTIARNQVWSSETALWTEATERTEGVAEAWYGLGDARRFGADFEGAITAYRQAIALDATHLDSWNNLGISLAELGDGIQARDAWRSALLVNPTYCKAHNNLGAFAMSREQWDEALVELRTTLVHCPGNPRAHYGLGLIYADKRPNLERAIFHFEELLRIDPDFSRSQEVQAKLLELTW
jgi:Tfp pilus assembly protein PilF